MEEMGYPHLEQHRETHAQLLREVNGLQDEARAGDRSVMNRLLIFLQSWLVGHIMGIDKKYAAYAESCGREVL